MIMVYHLLMLTEFVSSVEIRMILIGNSALFTMTSNVFIFLSFYLGPESLALFRKIKLRRYKIKALVKMKIKKLFTKKPKTRNKRRSGGKKNPFYADVEALPAPEVSTNLRDLAKPKSELGQTKKKAFNATTSSKG